MFNYEMRTLYSSAFIKPEMIKELNRLHEENVLVPVDKACNSIVFVCKAYHYQSIINELGINSTTAGNRTYTPTTFSINESLQNHASVVSTSWP
jgi:hypothetical protein